ncbi:MAG: hypothetical protein KBA81_08085 [Rhabdochlamydiaceae bacterium]|nr:hypothetical protein [Rhabdochlamydiaceae bacterium]
MSSISFTTFSKHANNILSSILPQIETTKQRVYQALEPGTLKDSLLENLGYMKRSLFIMADLANIADGAIAAFSKACNMIEEQVTFMNRNTKCITVAMLTLLLADTKYLNPESSTDKKLSYLRTTLKIVGYAALVTALVLTLNAKEQIKSGVFQFDMLTSTIQSQSASLLAHA